jgi:pimeloyl-ACP methyl ester carboxylesterase
VQYDLYQPLSTSRKTLLLLHGMTLEGERDARLVHFARVFAAAGFRVAAISLEGFKHCREDPGDVSATRELIAELHHESGKKVGVLGFSFGGGIALVAANHPSMHSLIGPLLTIGAYHSIQEVWESFCQAGKRPPRTEEEWDDHIYIRLALAFRIIDDLDLNEDRRVRLIRLLQNYCTGSSPEEKRSYYEKELKTLDILEASKQAYDPGAFRSISPAGQLAEIDSAVMLLHDSQDGIIPSSHSRRIFEELVSGKNSAGQKLLITPLLSHVTAGNLWRVGDLTRMLGMFGELFRHA